MALSSMTGFARASGHRANMSWAWDVKSVNGKAFDLRLRLPPGFDHLEVQARTVLAQSFKRGNFQASLNIESANENATVRINELVLEQVVREAEKLRYRLGGAAPQPEALLALRGVMEASAESLSEAETQALDEALLDSLVAAAKDLTKSRRDEGARLKLILDAQLKQVAELTQLAKVHPARTTEKIKVRLREQVAKLMEASSSFDEERLHQEAVLLSTRSDIAEEIDRLNSHVEAAQALLKSSEPIGRKFDFLAQEFNREANTLCSKSNDKSLTAIGLELKTVIDQLREQVQNIE